jgi:hypothetical protein
MLLIKLFFFSFFLLFGLNNIGYHFSRNIYNPLYRLSFSITVGLFISFCIMMILSLFKFLNLFWYFFLILSAFIFYIHKSHIQKTFRSISFSNYVIFTFFFCILFLLTLGEPGLWDDTSYHLPYAKHIYINSGFIPNEDLRFPYFPLTPHLFFSQAYTLGLNEYGAQVISIIPIITSILFLLYLMDYYNVKNINKFILCFTFILISPIKYSLGYAYIDNFIILFSGIGTYSMFFLKDKLLIYLSSIISLYTVSFKYICILFLVILVPFVKIKKYLNKKYYLIILLFAPLIIYWYVLNFYYSGNPFHPFFSNFFPLTIWDSEDINLMLNHTASYRVNFFKELDFHYLLKNGFFIFLAPLVIIFYKKRNFYKILAYPVIVFFILWLSFFAVDRYLAPILLITFSMFIYLFAETQKYLRKLFVLFLILFFYYNFYENEHIYKKEYTFFGSTVLSNKIPGRNEFEFLNKYNNVRILQIGFENSIYYSKNKTIGDHFGKIKYSRFIDNDNEINFLKIYEFSIENNINFVVINKNKYTLNDDQFLLNGKISKIKENKQAIVYSLRFD